MLGSAHQIHTEILRQPILGRHSPQNWLADATKTKEQVFIMVKLKQCGGDLAGFQSRPLFIASTGSSPEMVCLQRSAGIELTRLFSHQISVVRH
jgi:hypothetical protein